MDPNVKVT